VFGADFGIRICQFHVIQAIRRWTGVTNEDDKPHFTRKGMNELLDEFRKLQRARTEEDWEDAAEEFFTRLQELCAKYERKESYDRIKKYFVDNWMDSFWGRSYPACAFFDRSADLVIH
jgi:hypothetical protein